MAHQAAADGVGGDAHALVQRGLVGVFGLAGGHIPAHRVGIVRQPVLERPILPVVADQGQPAVPGAEGIVDDRLKCLVRDVGLHLEMVAAPGKDVADRGVARIGDGPIRKSERRDLFLAHEGARVPAVVLRLIIGLVAIPALRLADERGRLGFQGVGLAIRVSLGRDRRTGGQPLLEVATAEEPAGFGVVGPAGDLVNRVAGGIRTAGPQQEPRELLADAIGALGAVPLVGSGQGSLERLGGSGRVGLLGEGPTEHEVGARFPARLGGQVPGRTRRLVEQVQPEEHLLEGHQGLDVVDVLAQRLPPDEDAVLLLAQAHQGLTAEEVILGRQELVRQPCLDRQGGLVAALSKQGSGQEPLCLDVVVVDLELRPGGLLGSRPVV